MMMKPNNDDIEEIVLFEKNNFGKEAYSKKMLMEVFANTDIVDILNVEQIRVIKKDDKLISYVIFMVTEDFTDIYKIFVKEKYRRQGFANMLIDEVSSMARKYNSKKLMVEVRETNDNAIKFYECYGFEKISIRKNYYTEPSCSAVIYEKRL